MNVSPEMIDKLTETLVAGLLLVIPVVFAILAEAGRNLLKTLDEKAQAEMGQAQWDHLKTMAWQFVMAADQMGVFEFNDQKKAWAVNMLMEAAQALGVPMTYGQAEAIVEATVKEFKVWQANQGDGAAQ